MQEHAEQYRAVRERLTAFLRGLDESRLDDEVPACPGWRVRDVVAHLVGVATDVATGNMGNAPSDEWTAAHLERLRGRSIDEVLDAWDDAGAALEELLTEAPPQMGVIAVVDATSHELDVRSAVGDTGARDALLPHVRGFVGALGKRLDDAGVPALRVVADGEEMVAGRKSEPSAAIEGTSFELLRALTGRRSRDQIRAMFTEGDPLPHLAYLSIFDIRATDLLE